MQLSIIIPVYNEENNLRKRLSFLSVIAYKKPIEIIISNSPETTDNTVNICKKYDNVLLYKSPKKGRAFQMNFGASKATGDIVAFLHADVQLPTNFYEEMTTAIKNNFKAGFFSYNFDRSSFMLNINSYFTKKDGLLAGGGDQCQFFFKSTFNKLKGYNENYCIMEDFEMMDRIRDNNIKYTVIQSRATVSARKYDNNSWLKVNLINSYIFMLYKMGVKPITLRKKYKNLLREFV